MHFKIEIEREDDDRWIAEVPDLPGVMTYGTSREQAWRMFRLSLFACWQIAWTVPKPLRIRST